jgi:hypothetical protein
MPPASAPGWLRKTLFQPRVLIALAIVGAAFLLAPYVRQRLPILEELPEYQFEVARTRTTAPHRWVPRGFIQQLVEEGRLPAEVSLLEEGLAQRIAGVLEDYPWVKRVESLRVARSGIIAELVYRLPVLMIETRTGLYPVDRDGTLLPPMDFSVSDLHRFPLLRGAATTPSGPAGTDWGDPVVLGAARLAEVLAPEGDLSKYWDRFQLEAIEAPPRVSGTVKLEEVAYELVTRGRSRIVWGRAPGADDLEPTAAQKLGRLETYFSSHGGFETQGTPNRIDIRQFETIEVSSLAPAPPGTAR